MTVVQNGVLKYGHFGDFWSIVEDRMANLGLIDFKIGLCIKVNVNAGKNKFEVHFGTRTLNWA